MQSWKVNERANLNECADQFWEILRRDDQTPPVKDWTTWLLLGGRGAGKTRAGAEWIRGLALDHWEQVFTGVQSQSTQMRIALVAETYADAREVMVEGTSGLCAIGFEDERPIYEASRRRVVWPGGAVAHCFSAEDPDGIRGYQFHAAWSDELCKWRYPEETWSNLQLALRLGKRPQQVVTTTPRPMALLKRLLAAKDTVVSRASSYANRANLSDAFFTEIASVYEGTALGRQELMGELVENVHGALWTWSMIEASRISQVPELDRIVIAVDPPASSGPDADECGIVVAGLCIGEEPHENIAYVLADHSLGQASPRQWGEATIAAYEEYQADRIIAEVNQGGEMVRHVLHQIDPNAAVRMVHARHGKRHRCEPIAALYETGRVRHVGSFPALEDQMTHYTGERAGAGASRLNRNNTKSPDRLDALVWALTDLMVRPFVKPPGVRQL